MKKIICMMLALVLTASLLLMSAGAASPAKVGYLNKEQTVISGITTENIATVRNLIRKEYNRGIQTRSVKDKGTKYFDYGDSTEEYVHAWLGNSMTTLEGQSYQNAAMGQDFSGGNSDCLSVMGIPGNWCCIVVTPRSLEKGEAYTVRDGIAWGWGNAGATNSTWGMPTDNQRWIEGDYGYASGWYCYQMFDWGYAIAYEGQMVTVEFHRYDEEGYNPPSGGELDYDWGVAQSTIGNPSPDLALDNTLMGDVDGDNTVTVSDVVALRDVIMSATPSNTQVTHGDFDESGSLSVSDVVDLRDWIMSGKTGNPYTFTDRLITVA